VVTRGNLLSMMEISLCAGPGQYPNGWLSVLRTQNRVDSAFCPWWDGKMNISFQAEYSNKWWSIYEPGELLHNRQWLVLLVMIITATITKLARSVIVPVVVVFFYWVILPCTARRQLLAFYSDVRSTRWVW